MELHLSHSIGDRHTEYPAAVLTDLVVRALDGQADTRRWQGIIDTGADLSVLPVEIADELRLPVIRQKIRVWTYRKDEPPREVDVHYVRLELPSGLEILTKAITSPRHNILIGRCALLERYGARRKLVQASLDELQLVKGIGKSKVVAIKSAFLLVQRLATEAYPEPRIMDLPDRVAELLRERAANRW